MAKRTLHQPTDGMNKYMHQGSPADGWMAAEERTRRHRLPRGTEPGVGQKVTAVLALLLALAIGAVMMANAIAHAAGVQLDVGEYPQTLWRWANVNARDVNFREAPDLSARVVASYSWGVAVEVVKVEDGWAEVWQADHLHLGRPLYVWAEYLDMVE